MKQALVLLVLLCLAGCQGSIVAGSSDAPACYTATPEAGGDVTLCVDHYAGRYVTVDPQPLIVTVCDRPAQDPYSSADLTNNGCSGISYAGGRVWCCVPIAKPGATQ